MEIVIAFFIVLATSFVKGFIKPKYGETGIHVFTFTIALTAVGVWQYLLGNPSMMAVFHQSIAVLAGAIAMYEVLLKKLDFVNGER